MHNGPRRKKNFMNGERRRGGPEDGPQRGDSAGDLFGMVESRDPLNGGNATSN